MPQIVIFKSEFDKDIQTSVNDWLSKNHVKLLSSQLQISEQYIRIMLVYENVVVSSKSQQ